MRNNYQQFYLHNEKNILIEISKGSQNAFEEIFHLYFEDLCRFVYSRFIHDIVESQEIVEKVFIKIWENREKITEITSIKAYLYKSVTNASINFLEHQKVKQKYFNKTNIALLKYEFDENIFPDQEQEELYQRVLIEIEKLPDQTRKIFTLKYIEGLKYKEIAKMLDISEKTVETLLCRGLKTLRSKFFST